MAGLDSVGGFLNGYVKENPKAFLTLFCDKSSPLNVQRMKSLYVIKWSEDGSNQREAEETTISTDISSSIRSDVFFDKCFGMFLSL